MSGINWRLKNASRLRNLEWGKCVLCSLCSLLAVLKPFILNVLFILGALFSFSYVNFPHLWHVAACVCACVFLQIDSIHKLKQFHWGNFLWHCDRALLAEILESYKIELILIYFDQKFLFRSSKAIHCFAALVLSLAFLIETSFIFGGWRHNYISSNFLSLVPKENSFFNKLYWGIIDRYNCEYLKCTV